MIKKYPKVEFPYDRMKLQPIFTHPELENYHTEGVQGEVAREIYGSLMFPDPPKHRAYTYGSLVMSIDGKIAYLDNPAGPVIASANVLDPDGGKADFWILNLYRASADVIIAGAGTMHKEPDGTVCIMDQELEDERLKRNLSQAPWVVIVSLDGTDVRWEDELFVNQPTMFHSSPFALEVVKDKLAQDYFVIGPYENLQEVLEDEQRIRSQFVEHSASKMSVIITGKDKTPDEEALLGILSLLGMKRCLVETPSYCMALMKKKLLDEFVLNVSCVFVGGEAMSIGKSFPAFTSVDHPHTEVLSLHMHSPSYFYYRHKLVYQDANKL